MTLVSQRRGSLLPPPRGGWSRGEGVTEQVYHDTSSSTATSLLTTHSNNNRIVAKKLYPTWSCCVCLVFGLGGVRTN